MGQSRPPEVLDHPKGWERGPVTAVRRPEISDGDDGGIRKRCVGFESALIRLFGLAGKVCAGGVQKWCVGFESALIRLLGFAGKD